MHRGSRRSFGRMKTQVNLLQTAVNELKDDTARRPSIGCIGRPWRRSAGPARKRKNRSWPRPRRSPWTTKVTLVRQCFYHNNDFGSFFVAKVI